MPVRIMAMVRPRPASVTGVMSPKPTVVMVTTEKYTASRNVEKLLLLVLWWLWMLWLQEEQVALLRGEQQVQVENGQILQKALAAEMVKHHRSKEGETRRDQRRIT